MVLELVVEALGHDPPPALCLCGSHEGDLHQHGGGEVDALHQLQVDVHVEGDLPPALNLLLFGRPFVSSNQTLEV